MYRQRDGREREFKEVGRDLSYLTNQEASSLACLPLYVKSKVLTLTPSHNIHFLLLFKGLPTRRKFSLLSYLPFCNNPAFRCTKAQVTANIYGCSVMFYTILKEDKGILQQWVEEFRKKSVVLHISPIVNIVILSRMVVIDPNAENKSWWQKRKHVLNKLKHDKTKINQ